MSMWSMHMRAHRGAYYRTRGNLLCRYVSEFASRYKLGELDITDYMVLIAMGFAGRRLINKEADCGSDCRFH